MRSPQRIPTHTPSPAAREPQKPASTRNSGLVVALLVVAALVSFVHWPVLGAQARAWDDNLFVSNNPLVTQPSWNSTRRFFAEVLDPSSIGGYYLPLSMTSLMLDHAMGGRTSDLTVFHRTNLALHVLTVIVLGLILHSLFGQPIPAAIAALLFGLHPLTVEPVAWISERKTLLATAFSLLSVLSYLLSRRPSSAWRLGSVAFFVLALLSKPSVTPLPMVLVVLDWWPLMRLRRSSVLSKWPWFALSVASIAITTVSQLRTAPIQPLGDVGLLRPFLQICYLLTFYAGKILWPLNLSNVYTPPKAFELADPLIAASVGAVLGAATLVLVLAPRMPGLLAGALVFLIALSPTFVILSWSQIIAYDRYLYFPAFGVLLGVGAALSRCWARGGRHTRLLRFVVVLLSAGLAVGEARGARLALAHWRDSVALWGNAVEVSRGSVAAHQALGLAHEDQGEFDLAEKQYRIILAQVPADVFALISLGTLQSRRGQFTEACSTLAVATSVAPGDPNIAYEWGLAEKGAGRIAAAEAQFRRAIELDSTHVVSLDHLGTLLVMTGRREEGIGMIRSAVALAPANAHPQFSLAMVLLETGAPIDQAMQHLRRAAHLQPEWTLPLSTLAWILATSPDTSLRDGEQALELAVRARNLAPHPSASLLDSYAAALAASGRFEPAIEVAQAAVERAEQSRDPLTAGWIRSRLEGYRRREPYVDSTLAR